MDRVNRIAHHITKSQAQNQSLDEQDVVLSYIYTHGCTWMRLKSFY